MKKHNLKIQCNKMKKIMLFFCAALALLPVNGQTAGEHMTFKGVPINGSLTDFTAKMKQKGFAHLGSQNGIAVFEGEFAAQKECTIAVLCSKSTNTVSRVMVIFPKCETWSLLYGRYGTLKELLTQKYGEPSENMEVFEGLYKPDDDKDRMSAVKGDRCKYISVWGTSKGDVELAIDHEGYSRCFVRLTYSDKINMEKMTNAAIDDL